MSTSEALVSDRAAIARMVEQLNDGAENKDYAYHYSRMAVLTQHINELNTIEGILYKIDAISSLRGAAQVEAVKKLFTYLMSDCRNKLAVDPEFKEAARNKCNELISDPRARTITGVLQAYMDFDGSL